jgi:hypothetical protein
VSLRTWPDLQPVAASIVQKQSSTSSTGDRRAYIEIQAQAPLADTWHAVRVATLPPPLSWPRYPAYTGKCIDTSTNPKHCGACDLPCAAGQTCVDRKCV